MKLELSPEFGILQSPVEMRGMTVEDLKNLSKQVRGQVIKQLVKSSRYMNANLAVVDLAIALHHLFNSPYDKVMWDIGYQTAAHKLLTGQNPSSTQLLSPTKYHNDNVWEFFDGSHAGSTLSAASGLSEARDILGKSNHVVCVIDDVSLGSGLTLEALLQIGASASKVIVIVNHFQRSSQTRPNALVEYFERISALRPYHKIKDIAQEMGRDTPGNLRSVIKHAEEIINSSQSDGELFEQLGFLYTGPLDGNEISQLIPALKNIRDREEAGPVLVHIITDENKVAVESSCITSNAPKQKHGCGFMKIAVKQLHRQAEIDNRIVFVSSHNMDECPISPLKRDFYNKFYEFPLSDQHAVAFAAGLACEGLKPIVFMRSAFFSKCADQIINDVAMQNLPVRFIVDGAGLSSRDGPKYAGIQDVSMLSGVPNINIMAPADREILPKMIGTLLANNDSPTFMKFPDTYFADTGEVAEVEPWSLGKGRVLRTGHRVALISFGTVLQECLKAQDELAKHGIAVTVADACFASPLDEQMILELADKHEIIVCVEDGPVGGFCAKTALFIMKSGYFGKAITQVTLEEDLVLRGSRRLASDKPGICSERIIKEVQKILQEKRYDKLSMAS